MRKSRKREDVKTRKRDSKLDRSLVFFSYPLHIILFDESMR